MQLVPDDERTAIFDENTLVGYVEGDNLYGLDGDGFAVHIGEIDHLSEVQPKLETWRKSR